MEQSFYQSVFSKYKNKNYKKYKSKNKSHIDKFYKEYYICY